MFSQSIITFISFFKSKKGQQRPITTPKGTLGWTKTREPAQPGKPNRKMTKRAGSCRLSGYCSLKFSFRRIGMGGFGFQKPTQRWPNPSEYTTIFCFIHISTTAWTIYSLSRDTQLQNYTVKPLLYWFENCWLSLSLSLSLSLNYTTFYLLL
jgi:hypothetical protein